jgi:hypothetical protein
MHTNRHGKVRLVRLGKGDVRLGQETGATNIQTTYLRAGRATVFPPESTTQRPIKVGLIMARSVAAVRCQDSVSTPSPPLQEQQHFGPIVWISVSKVSRVRWVMRVFQRYAFGSRYHPRWVNPGFQRPSLIALEFVIVHRVVL